MSKRSAALERIRRTPREVGPVTRKQQVAALRATKGQEVAASVAVQVSKQMKELVDKAVEDKFKAVLDTMTDLIDRVVGLENNGVKVLNNDPPTDEDCYCGVQRYHCLLCGYVGPDMKHPENCQHCTVPLAPPCKPQS